MFELYLTQVMTGRRKNRILSLFLHVLSWCYQFLVFLRNFAYDRGWVRSKTVSIPVVSVGNIVAGGTGKTPIVQMLAKELMEFGTCAILSRGYRSRVEKSGTSMRVVPETCPSESGDEPSFLVRTLPEVLVFAGKKRTTSAELALLAGAQVILLDDGMQHRQLKRDFEVVVIDAKDPFGGGHFLPRGFLRDPPKRLRGADLIVATHIEDEREYNAFKEQIARYSRAPVVGARMSADLDLRGKKVGLFCGIGKPERFIQTVRALGADIVGTLIAKDHGVFCQKKLDCFAQTCMEEKAELLVCTEKDAVKLSSALCLPVKPVKVDLKIVAGEPHLRIFIARLCTIFSEQI